MISTKFSELFSGALSSSHEPSNLSVDEDGRSNWTQLFEEAATILWPLVINDSTLETCAINDKPTSEADFVAEAIDHFLELHLHHRPPVRQYCCQFICDLVERCEAFAPYCLPALHSLMNDKTVHTTRSAIDAICFIYTRVVTQIFSAVASFGHLQSGNDNSTNHDIAMRETAYHNVRTFARINKDICDILSDPHKLVDEKTDGKDDSQMYVRYLVLQKSLRILELQIYTFTAANKKGKPQNQIYPERKKKFKGVYNYLLPHMTTCPALAEIATATVRCALRTLCDVLRAPKLKNPYVYSILVQTGGRICVARPQFIHEVLPVFSKLSVSLSENKLPVSLYCDPSCNEQSTSFRTNGPTLLLPEVFMNYSTSLRKVVAIELFRLLASNVRGTSAWDGEICRILNLLLPIEVPAFSGENIKSGTLFLEKHQSLESLRGKAIRFFNVRRPRRKKETELPVNNAGDIVMQNSGHYIKDGTEYSKHKEQNESCSAEGNFVCRKRDECLPLQWSRGNHTGEKTVTKRLKLDTSIGEYSEECLSKVEVVSWISSLKQSKKGLCDFALRSLCSSKARELLSSDTDCSKTPNVLNETQFAKDDQELLKELVGSWPDALLPSSGFTVPLPGECKKPWTLQTMPHEEDSCSGLDYLPDNSVLGSRNSQQCKKVFAVEDESFPIPSPLPDDNFTSDLLVADDINKTSLIPYPSLDEAQRYNKLLKQIIFFQILRTPSWGPKNLRMAADSLLIRNCSISATDQSKTADTKADSPFEELRNEILCRMIFMETHLPATQKMFLKYYLDDQLRSINENHQDDPINAMQRVVTRMISLLVYKYTKEEVTKLQYCGLLKDSTAKDAACRFPAVANTSHKVNEANGGCSDAVMNRVVDGVVAAPSDFGLAGADVLSYDEVFAIILEHLDSEFAVRGYSHYAKYFVKFFGDAPRVPKLGFEFLRNKALGHAVLCKVSFVILGHYIRSPSPTNAQRECFITFLKLSFCSNPTVRSQTLSFLNSKVYKPSQVNILTLHSESENTVASETSDLIESDKLVGLWTEIAAIVGVRLLAPSNSTFSHDLKIPKRFHWIPQLIQEDIFTDDKQRKRCMTLLAVVSRQSPTLLIAYLDIYGCISAHGSNLSADSKQLLEEIKNSFSEVLQWINPPFHSDLESVILCYDHSNAFLVRELLYHLSFRAARNVNFLSMDVPVMPHWVVTSIYTVASRLSNPEMVDDLLLPLLAFIGKEQSFAKLFQLIKRGDKDRMQTAIANMLLPFYAFCGAAESDQSFNAFFFTPFDLLKSIFELTSTNITTYRAPQSSIPQQPLVAQHPVGPIGTLDLRQIIAAFDSCMILVQRPPPANWPYNLNPQFTKDPQLPLPPVILPNSFSSLLIHLLNNESTRISTPTGLILQLPKVFGRLMVLSVCHVPSIHRCIVDHILSVILLPSKQVWRDSITWKGVVVSIVKLWAEFNGVLAPLVTKLPKNEFQTIVQELNKFNLNFEASIFENSKK